MKLSWKAFTSVCLLAAAVWLLDWEGLKRATAELSPWLLLLAVGVTFGQYVAMGFRWHALIGREVRVNLRASIAHYFYGTMLNMLTPSNIGGDVYRFFSFRGRGRRGGLKVVGPLVRERALGLLSFFLAFLFCAGGLLAARVEALRAGGALFLVSGAVSVAGVLAFLVAPRILSAAGRWGFLRRRGRVLAGLESAGNVFRFRSAGEMALLLGLSGFAIAAWIATIAIVAADIGMEAPWLVLGAVAIAVEVVRMIPVSIQGLGVREAGFAYALGALGFPPESGFILGTVSYLILNVAMALCGIVGWAALPRAYKRRVR